jgi:MFS family permease
MIGRLTLGFSVGILSTVAQKYIEESVPTNLYDYFSPLIVLGCSIGSICAFSLGFLLPDENGDD